MSLLELAALTLVSYWRCSIHPTIQYHPEANTDKYFKISTLKRCLRTRSSKACKMGVRSGLRRRGRNREEEGTKDGSAPGRGGGGEGGRRTFPSPHSATSHPVSSILFLQATESVHMLSSINWCDALQKTRGGLDNKLRLYVTNQKVLNVPLKWDVQHKHLVKNPGLIRCLRRIMWGNHYSIIPFLIFPSFPYSSQEEILLFQEMLIIIRKSIQTATLISLFCYAQKIRALILWLHYKHLPYAIIFLHP